MSRANPLFIIAGNYNQAKYYARDHGLTPKDWVYADYHWKIRGYKKAEYVLIGTYYERRDLHDILEVMRYQEFVEQPKKKG